MATFTETLTENAADQLRPALDPDCKPADRIACFKQFLENEHKRLQEFHREGGGGLEVASNRAAIFDKLLKTLIQANLPDDTTNPDFALVAIGGYGRALLNPASDIDLLFLLPVNSTRISGPLKEQVQLVLYALWDLGLKIGHASRSIAECIEQARLDQENKTALMDARLITGDSELYGHFKERFAKECINKDQVAFFELRRQDLKSRHEKYSHTVFLQEPSVKESCGGMRDFQTIEWVARVKIGSSDLQELVKRKLITAASKRELEEGYDFIHRVRNELHFYTGKGTDQLTLQLQGVVATSFQYPQPDILRSTEAFMRDYYRHTRHIHRHTTSLMEAFEIEREQEMQSGFRSFLTFRRAKVEEFDGFVSRDGRLFPANKEIFEEDPTRLMRLFQHCQMRDLKLSPQLRRLIANHWNDIDRPFRYLKANRRIFQSILERKGEVARILRLMHRIGVLGRYLPEFGALDCLVQHEFFHRYTADEHTLRCIDELDALVTTDDPAKQTFKRLLHEIADPYALYLAMILHDTGRSENVREHIDGSAMLASRLCNRMQISGARRKLIMFLVDNHLTFWRTATTRNLDDPEVIEEFAAIMKNQSNLDALFLFTYADSNATSPESWNGWKQALMFQLHAATTRFLEKGRKQYDAQLDEERIALRDEVIQTMRDDYRQDIQEHFERMPDAAFHFRGARHIVTQIRTVRHFLKAEQKRNDDAAFCIKWIDYPNKAYTELILAARDRPLLLEKVCCGLASEQLNILSADLFTRTDGIVVNIFRVCTTNFETVSSESTRKSFLKTFEDIQHADSFEPAKYLKRRQNFLAVRTDKEIPVPVRAYVSNDIHPTCTTVELQALDRIGLLHDLFHAINENGLNTVHARICTEKGVAMDTLYITDNKGHKIEDEEVLERLEREFTKLIARADEAPA
ncbi:MAG: [protein-PII] uridylyltransferase [Akkermansiaceae bacterium]|nr:[protein-PII] uridylyltransferase [Akkermansiaceae bacterium]